MVADAGDAAAKHHICHPGHIQECTSADAGHRIAVEGVGDGDIAAGACITGNRDGSVVRYISEIRRRIIQGGREPAAEGSVPARRERHIIHRARFAAEDRGVIAASLPAIHQRRVPLEIRLGQARAILEAITAYTGDTGGNGYCRQGRTVLEGPRANAGDAAAKHQVRQAGTILERVIADGGDTIGNGHVQQAGTIIECTIADIGDAAAERHVRQVVTNAECI